MTGIELGPQALLSPCPFLLWRTGNGFTEEREDWGLNTSSLDEVGALGAKTQLRCSYSTKRAIQTSDFPITEA